MTRIDFYQLRPDGQSFEQVVCQLCQKAYESKKKTLLLTQNEAQSKLLDAKLWTFAEESFVPHDTAEEAGLSSPILIQDNPDPKGDRELLINLTASVPIYFAQFDRVIELVTEENKSAARDRYSYYKERGYPLKHVTL